MQSVSQCFSNSVTVMIARLSDTDMMAKFFISVFKIVPRNVEILVSDELKHMFILSINSL